MVLLREMKLGVMSIINSDYQMTIKNLIKETSRQLSVCNACRYCEGFCPVWDAIEYRTRFDLRDIVYLSNLCHDCGQCFAVCPFVPPHEFSIDIPKVMSEVRTYTYKDYSVPKSAAKLFETPLLFLGVMMAISFVVIFLLYRYTSSSSSLFSSITFNGSFYVVLPNEVIDISGLTLGFLITVIATVSGLKFLLFTNSSGKIKLSDLIIAIKDSFAETWLKGGGAGCNYPEREEEGSYKKMTTHLLILYGFILDFLSTISAFIEQDAFRLFPPYSLISIPVILGLSGGILLTVGVMLFLNFDLSKGSAKDRRARAMDQTFLLNLLFTAVTGLFLLALRNTNIMSVMLLIHLSSVGALFITAPYGKFVHFVYRFFALVRYHQEKRVLGS